MNRSCVFSRLLRTEMSCFSGCCSCGVLYQRPSGRFTTTPSPLQTAFRIVSVRHGSTVRFWRNYVQPKSIKSPMHARRIIEQLSSREQEMLLAALGARRSPGRASRQGLSKEPPVSDTAVSDDRKTVIDYNKESSSPVTAATTTMATRTVLPARPSLSQLCHVFVFTGIPFVGFGVLDNTIMLTAGGYIEVYFGALLGISTLAAAALGNMKTLGGGGEQLATVSDIAGITTAGVVEELFAKIGFDAPDLSSEQSQLRITKLVGTLGRCVFVVVGCFIGMFPLLFLPDSSKCSSDSD